MEKLKLFQGLDDLDDDDELSDDEDFTSPLDQLDEAVEFCDAFQSACADERVPIHRAEVDAGRRGAGTGAGARARATGSRVSASARREARGLRGARCQWLTIKQIYNRSTLSSSHTLISRCALLPRLALLRRQPLQPPLNTHLLSVNEPIATRGTLTITTMIRRRTFEGSTNQRMARTRSPATDAAKTDGCGDGGWRRRRRCAALRPRRPRPEHAESRLRESRHLRRGRGTRDHSSAISEFRGTTISFRA